ncbi:MAG TPA: diacylglycerol kinase family protein [Candidatus Omnitrophota bacterium]|nr:diacylglycerol kinase family protein [Candidatus Omnitrophota bacterium]HRZ15143.1 diacylglycerol kinase family protein [Candidatus Omnitrophota bacterium]
MPKRYRIFRRIFQFHGFWESLRLAFNGLLYLFLYHRNMRIIFLCGIAAFLLGIYCALTGLELVTLCLTITMVFMAEMFNTAIEMTIDMFTRKYKILIKLVKDIAAAVVLIASLNAIAVGVILFGRKIVSLPVWHTLLSLK